MNKYPKQIQLSLKMKIGITIGLTKDNESLWINGIKLNILILAKTLMQIPGYEVWILDTGKVVQDLTKVSWDTNVFKTYKLDDKRYEVDLLFMIGTSLPTSYITDIKSKNPSMKVVKYQCGNNYVVDMERVLFDTAPENAVPSWDPGHDETWMIPQQEYHNRDYFQLVYRQQPDQVKVVPFVWDPMFLDDLVSKYQKIGRKTPVYTPKESKEKKISVMEPNLNVLKYAMVPIMITENLLRQDGDQSFKQLFIGSGERILKNKYFKNQIKLLDIVKHNPPLVKFVPRYPIIMFLAEETDVVLSHQWGNPLNYAYLDALYFNYPLVHNAEMIQDAGYYYPNFEINKGTDALKKAIYEHDSNIQSYSDNNQKILERYRSTNPDVVDTYKKLIENLFEKDKHKMSYKYNWKTNLYE